MAARRKKTEDTISRDEVCPEHFPGGVPADTATVGCDHGTFRLEPADAPADGDEGDE